MYDRAHMEAPDAAAASLAGVIPGGVRQSLVDIAYVGLRDAITSGALLPGTRLREAALARHFSVSTTPVREALRRLDREGLVRLSPNRGAIVAEFNLREIIDLFEIREVLETHAVRRAATNEHRDLEAAKGILAAATNLLSHPVRVEWNRLEVGFHRTLNEMCGNVELADLTERIHRTVQGLCVRLLREPVFGTDMLSRLLDEHRRIIDAVCAGDAAEAEAAARGHIHHIRDGILHVLNSEGR
jgi:DNA-binding GntR family transcriptional regulator